MTKYASILCVLVFAVLAGCQSTSTVEMRHGQGGGDTASSGDNGNDSGGAGQR